MFNTSFWRTDERAAEEQPVFHLVQKSGQTPPFSVYCLSCTSTCHDGVMRDIVLLAGSIRFASVPNGGRCGFSFVFAHFETKRLAMLNN